MGTMEATDDIDTQGYWTTDDFEALLGLAAYRYIASTLGNTTEAPGRPPQYASLLAATNAVLGADHRRYHLDYLPCSLAAAQHRQPLQQPRGRQLDLAVRHLGLGGLAPRSHASAVPG